MHKRTLYLAIDLEIRDDSKLLTEDECLATLADILRSGVMNIPIEDGPGCNVGMAIRKLPPSLQDRET